MAWLLPRADETSLGQVVEGLGWPGPSPLSLLLRPGCLLSRAGLFNRSLVGFPSPRPLSRESKLFSFVLTLCPRWRGWLPILLCPVQGLREWEGKPGNAPHTHPQGLRPVRFLPPSVQTDFIIVC